MPQVALRFVICASLGLVACRTGRDSNSGPDGRRIHAVPFELNTIIDDTLDAGDGDATDWKSIQLQELSRLEVQLHWDSPDVKMQMVVFDSLGRVLRSGELSGSRGLKAELPRAVAGRYYVMVRVLGHKDDTTYSVKAVSSPVQPERCHDCTIGEQLCLRNDGYVVCESTPEGCNAWVTTFACKPDERCYAGACRPGCKDQCREEQRRCASTRRAQVCRRTRDGCLRWSTPRSCPVDGVCEHGTCRKRREPPAATKHIPGKIISIVRQGNQRVLHIEIGPDSGIRVGDTGFVLSGSSDDPLDNGSFRVKRVTGKYCIATTQLRAVGKNRRVRIRVE